jgi:hypothetical protein
MANEIRDEDSRMELGRATGSRTFLRVVHEPTQTSREVVGMNGRPSAQIIQELHSAVLQEIEAAGWRKPREGREASAEQPATTDRPRE